MSQLSDLSAPSPPRKKAEKKKSGVIQKRSVRKSALSSIKRTRSIVEAQANLPRSGTAASKRKAMIPANTTTNRLIEHLHSPLVQAYTAVMVNHMRNIERAKYGVPDPYAFAKTSFSSLINKVVRESLRENNEIDEETEVVVSIPNLTMAFLKCLHTPRLGNLIKGVTTIAESANRKRIAASHVMAYNRVSLSLDRAVRELPMSTGGRPIDLTDVNDSATEAYNLLRTNRKSVAQKKARAPRKKLTPEEREKSAKMKAELVAERKKRQAEAAAKKKEEVEARKKKRAEEAAERKRKKEEEAAEKKRKREEAALLKKKQQEAVAQKKKRREEAAKKKAEREKKEKEQTAPSATTDNLLDVLIHNNNNANTTSAPTKKDEIETHVSPTPETSITEKRAREEDALKDDIQLPPSKKTKKVEQAENLSQPPTTQHPPSGHNDTAKDLLDSILNDHDMGDAGDFDYDF